MATTAPDAVAEKLPPFDPAHVINLASSSESKIASVSLYSGRAELTRVYAFEVKIGLNNVCVTELPSVLDPDSLRVEGRGAATIHDVTISSTVTPPKNDSSPELKALLAKQELNSKAIDRTKNALDALAEFLETLNTKHVQAEQVGKFIDAYDSHAEQLEIKARALREEKLSIEHQIAKEKKAIFGPETTTEKNKPKLDKQVAIGVFATTAGMVEIALIYAVAQATWTAGYDIRVDMLSKEHPVALIYKAAIKQNTGESWDDVPLTLETATPTFGLGVPDLPPWTVSAYSHYFYSRAKSKGAFGGSSRGYRGGGGGGKTVVRSAFGSDLTELIEHTDDLSAALPMDHREGNVISKGNVSATFQIPGLISVPSDGDVHNFTIVRLDLDATMSWVAVPKSEPRVHLNAKVKNASEYTLLAGLASVYVDGSFISRSNVPAVSPQECFDCPLGLDPTIRVTYHPRSKKLSQSGFMQKTATHVFSQRITVFNTKPDAVSGVKIVDQFPISENSSIAVKMIAPLIPTASATVKDKLPVIVNLGGGVTAAWEGAEEPDVDPTTLGKNGKFHWSCAIPAQGKVNLTLSWEVSAPSDVDLIGL